MPKFADPARSINVKKQIRCEDELNLAYQRLCYHVENSPLGVIEFDKGLFISRWSRQAEEIFGYTSEEILGKNLYDPELSLIYEEDMPVVGRISFELMNGLTNRNQSLNRNCTKERRVIYCEWYNSVLWDERGDVVTILSIVQDVTERKKSEEQLNQSYAEIRSLSERLRTIREEERKYMAREIHDQLGQYLTLLKIDIGALRKKPAPWEEVTAKLNQLGKVTDDLVSAVRRIASELRPSLLDDCGLAAAIGSHLREFGSRSGIDTRFIEPEEDWRLPEPVKTHLFRIFQESLTNAARHSEATAIDVSLTKREGQLQLAIADNGTGFKDEQQRKNTLGILGMKERVSIIGGKYEIQSQPGQGTKIMVTVPLPGEKI